MLILCPFTISFSQQQKEPTTFYTFLNKINTVQQILSLHVTISRKIAISNHYMSHLTSDVYVTCRYTTSWNINVRELYENNEIHHITLLHKIEIQLELLKESKSMLLVTRIGSYSVFDSGVTRGGVWGVQTPSIEKGVHFCCLVIEQKQWLIIKIVVTRCRILRLKCTKFRFRLGSPRPHFGGGEGAQSAPQTP